MTHEAVTIAIDTGGTFTDAVIHSGGRTAAVKVPSTPADPAAAVLDAVRHALAALGLAADDRFGLLIHGSTVATNALLERRVADVALITNAGFEDVLVIGRQNRPQLYALAGDRPPPLVPRARRLGIAGRIGPGGEELEPQDAAELDRLADRVTATGAGSVAVCLLHSYARADHEAAAGAAVAPAGLPCTLSSELLPEYREFERTATTVINAAVVPLMDRYLGRLEAETRAGRIRIMGSGGGALAVSRARREAAHTVLSGPAGGVAGAMHVAARHGVRDIMTFDMGGTSTDVSLCPGAALHTREFTIAGLPLALPVLDIHTVGAGGGSIARVDAGGALRVGPESAGAVPGPVCYARGGTELTVTDANVVLGRLVPWSGGLPLDTAAAAAPVARLARQLGLEPGAAAEGVIAVANAAMEGALRVISVERGHDPADFTLVPFGGAAGLHAVALAERLGIPRLLVPPDPGVLSASGMLVAPVRRSATRSVLLSDVAGAGDVADAGIDAPFRELEAAALAAMAEEGVAADVVSLTRTVAARYLGQSHELAVDAADWPARFHDAHERRFGHARRDAAVEAVTLTVEALAASPAPAAPELPPAAGTARPDGRSSVRFEGDVVDAARYPRVTLRPGHVLRGPALVLEQTAAFWLPPGWSAHVARDGSLLVER